MINEKGWKLTTKGEEVMKEANKLLPEATHMVYSDQFMYTLHVAGGGDPKPPKWLNDYEMVFKKKVKKK